MIKQDIRIVRYLRQGLFGSPILLNIYVNDLIMVLDSIRIGCPIDDVCVINVSYADDMVRMSASICGLRILVAMYVLMYMSH